MKTPFYKSKACMGAVVLGVVAVYQILTSGSLQLLSIAEIGAALGIYGLRDAMNA